MRPLFLLRHYTESPRAATHTRDCAPPVLCFVQALVFAREQTVDGGFAGTFDESEAHGQRDAGLDGWPIAGGHSIGALPSPRKANPACIASTMMAPSKMNRTSAPHLSASMSVYQEISVEPRGTAHAKPAGASANFTCLPFHAAFERATVNKAQSQLRPGWTRQSSPLRYGSACRGKRPSGPARPTAYLRAPSRLPARVPTAAQGPPTN